MSSERHVLARARAAELRRELVLTGDLSVRPTDDGGRSNPIHPRYMSDALLWGAPDEVPTGEAVHGVGVLFEGDPIPPGATREVEIAPRYPEYWASVAVGDAIGLYEGVRRSATFVVRRPLDGNTVREWLSAEAASVPSAGEVEAYAAGLTDAVERYSEAARPRDIRQR
jgi:hypothetical protein